MPNNLHASKKLFSLYLPAAILLIYLVLAISSARYDDVTADEGAHLRYGIQILKRDPNRSVNEQRFRSTMPVSAFNAIPRSIEQLINPGLKKNDAGESDVKNGRLITILIGLLLLMYGYCFAKLLSSGQTACIVLSIIAFDPNILAHARLVTTDMYAAIGFVATIYHLWRWLAKADQRHFFYWCIAIAVAQCCKPTNVLLYIISIVPIVFFTYKNKRSFLLNKTMIKFLFFVVAQIIVINAFFLFSGKFGQSIAQINPRSDFFKSLSTSWVSKIPIPLPAAYTESFDLVQYERETFDGTRLNYLLGELRYKKGFWNYYLVCYLLKTPLVTIVLSVLGLIFACTLSRNKIESLIFCCWPCVFVVLFLSSSTIQNGFRYLLPVSSLLIIFSALLIEKISSKTSFVAMLPLLLIPFIIAVISFSNYISYTNIFVPDKKMAYRFLADSNINWGQRRSSLNDFMAHHPEYIFEPPEPVVGLIVVDLNNLAGIRGSEKFKWLRENYVPLASIDNCYLIYEVKQLPAKHH